MKPGRAALLRIASEEDFTRWVMRRAYFFGWHGIHVRWSQGVLQSLHTLNRDNYSECFGLPDWLFWHEELHQSFWAELKTWSGRLSRDQKRQIPSMRLGGMLVFEWRPQDEDEIERIFRAGVMNEKEKVNDVND